MQQVNFQAYASQRIGLVGKNGCGKSTLFRLIRGEVFPDSGEISLQSGKTIAFVEQEIANSDQPAFEFVLDGDVELRELEKIWRESSMIQRGSRLSTATRQLMAMWPKPVPPNC